ncbi:MAG: amidase family protein, partial [Nonlabens ulvanivorans]|uniref:amidase family protein n=1 Tax=Nonlabens ulvanivorans TaxID=906888 RepID=UPI003264E947
MLITKLTVKELQQQMTKGHLTSEVLVKQALQRIEQNTDYNAFITTDGLSALAQAKHYDQLRAKGEIIGPLHGIPLAVKDNIHVAGLANTAGTPALHDFIPTTDAGVIRLMKAAGAIIIGKTNLHELAYGITSNNKAYGSVKNAMDTRLFAGGSS